MHKTTKCTLSSSGNTQDWNPPSFGACFCVQPLGFEQVAWESATYQKIQNTSQPIRNGFKTAVLKLYQTCKQEHAHKNLQESFLPTTLSTSWQGRNKRTRTVSFFSLLFYHQPWNRHSLWLLRGQTWSKLQLYHHDDAHHLAAHNQFKQDRYNQKKGNRLHDGLVTKKSMTSWCSSTPEGKEKTKG